MNDAQLALDVSPILGFKDILAVVQNYSSKSSGVQRFPEYSNINSSILAMAIEKVVKMPYSNYDPNCAIPLQIPAISC